MQYNDNLPIIYASTSGNVELVVDYIGKLLTNKGVKASLHRSEITNKNILNSNYFIFATSTWEHGKLNPFFEPFLKYINETDCTNKYAGFVGCGDMRYEPVLFCEGIEIVKRAFLEKNGKQIGDTLKINGEPYEKLDSDVNRWVEDFYAKLINTNK